jgi:hypothetical protein
VDSPLVPIFLAVIALVAILQAAVVGGLAYAMRIAARKIAEVEETVSAQIEAQGEALSRLTEAAVRASQQTLVQAERLEDAVTGATEKVQSVMGAVSSRLEDTAGRVEDVAGDIDDEAEPVSGKLAQAAALFRGVQRAVEVWRETAPADGRARR